MATDGASDASTFPAADLEKELNPGQNKNFEVDTVSSDIAASKEIKEREADTQKKKEREKRDTMQTLKTTILVSAVIAAVAGAAFAITKN
ncbi:conserved hypothetical protein [Ricinus communis]|uniref:Uncharacterized protein n=1 Tax=Ricinus communis TaxID=3988 RepID=B9SWF8_RICCO|nr:conserved hypothetical protein [Ricinus communis]|eukprot:XP_002530327.1 uncharacterized protein LOC8263184 [Ricinus communis]